MSRARVNPALITFAMVNGTMAPQLNPDTGTMLRPAQLLQQIPRGVLHDRPGCRATWCREKARCQCTCKKCKRECRFRNLYVRVDERGLVHLKHPDGEVIAIVSREEYEKNFEIAERVRHAENAVTFATRQTGLTR